MDWLIRGLWRLRFRGKVRLLNPLIPAQGNRFARVFGVRIQLDLADFVQRMMYLGCYEREETNQIEQYLQPKMTFVDVGANAGYFTYLAASRVGPTGRVVSIEPDPLLFAKLTGALRDNRLDWVTTLNVGLGRKADELPLFIPPASHSNRSPTMTPVAGWEKVIVPVRTLDEVLEGAGIERVDLLKVDVEGFEAEVLAGGIRSLKSGRVRAVLCEFNHYWLSQHQVNPEHLYQTFTECGLRPIGPRPTFAPGTVVNCFFARNDP